MTHPPRVIPNLLLQHTGFVKTTRFARPVYLGDPINIVKLFNDMEVDELGILDISATREGRGPNVELLRNIADNAFMPLSYGGGLGSVDDIRTVLGIGYEKVVIGSRAAERPELVSEAARVVGNQSVVVSVDARAGLWGKYSVYTHNGKHRVRKTPAEYAREMEGRGAGEILLTSIDRDGTMSGYDIGLIRTVVDAVTVPVIAAGGAGELGDLTAAVREGGASAVAVGSMFVFHGPRRAVLVNTPSREELDAAFA